jgi:hypothetical protein
MCDNILGFGRAGHRNAAGANQARNTFAENLAALTCPVSVQDEPEAPAAQILDLLQSVEVNILQRHRFEKVRALRAWTRTHTCLPNTIPLARLTQNLRISKSEIFVRSVDRFSSDEMSHLSRLRNGCDAQPKKIRIQVETRVSISLHRCTKQVSAADQHNATINSKSILTLAATSRGFVSLSAHSSLAASKLTAPMRSFYSSLRALLLPQTCAWPAGVEATPPAGIFSHHCEATAT